MPQPYGQHFLRYVPHQLLQNLTQIPPKTRFHVLEIGPGRGAVTQAILKLIPHTAPGSTLALIEIDAQFIPHLQTIIAPYINSSLHVTIHQQDFLTFNLSNYWQNIPPHEPIVIIGSLPYESSKRIISRVVEQSLLNFFDKSSPTNINLPTHIIPHTSCSFIIQKEVAQAYTTLPPCTTFLSSWLHTFTTNIKAHTTIKSKQFSPPPRVTSQILSFSQPTLSSPLFSLINQISYSKHLCRHQFFKKDSRFKQQLLNTKQLQKMFIIQIYTDFLHQMFRYPRKKLRTAWQQYCLSYLPPIFFSFDHKNESFFISQNTCYDLHNNDIFAIINQRPGEITPLQFQQLFWSIFMEK